MTDFRLILIAIFVATTIILNGCSTNSQNVEWTQPPKPNKYPVTFVPMNDGIWIDKNSSENLLKTVEEMDAYTEKMETLVEHMKKYYGAK